MCPCRSIGRRLGGERGGINGDNKGETVAIANRPIIKRASIEIRKIASPRPEDAFCSSATRKLLQLLGINKDKYQLYKYGARQRSLSLTRVITHPCEPDDS